MPELHVSCAASQAMDEIKKPSTRADGLASASSDADNRIKRSIWVLLRCFTDSLEDRVVAVHSTIEVTTSGYGDGREVEWSGQSCSCCLPDGELGASSAATRYIAPQAFALELSFDTGTNEAMSIRTVLIHRRCVEWVDPGCLEAVSLRDTELLRNNRSACRL